MRDYHRGVFRILTRAGSDLTSAVNFSGGLRQIICSQICNVGMDEDASRPYTVIVRTAGVMLV